MYQLIDGKELAKNIRQELRKKVEKEKINAKLAIILVGDDSASKIYVKNKNKACMEVGIKYEEHILNKNIEMNELLKLISELNNRKDINGILLQAPLPKHLDINLAFNAIAPEKDVDGFNPINVGKLAINEPNFIPCTPLGIMTILHKYNIPIQGQNAVVIGRSNIVGKPMAQCLINDNATVTVCHSKTNNLIEYTKKADIVVCSVGKIGLITKDMVKEGVTIIDVGINRTKEGKLTGDVNFENVKEKCSFITPVPGGVGPMTIAMLMSNVIKAANGE